jgi:hypothetical protein
MRFFSCLYVQAGKESFSIEYQSCNQLLFPILKNYLLSYAKGEL